MNKNRKPEEDREWLPNELPQDEKTEFLSELAHEFADVRRQQWIEKDDRPDVYPCRLPISIDEILDLHELKILTTGAFK